MRFWMDGMAQTFPPCPSSSPVVLDADALLLAESCNEAFAGKWT